MYEDLDVYEDYIPNITPPGTNTFYSRPQKTFCHTNTPYSSTGACLFRGDCSVIIAQRTIIHHSLSLENMNVPVQNLK